MKYRRIGRKILVCLLTVNMLLLGLGQREAWAGQVRRTGSGAITGTDNPTGPGSPAKPGNSVGPGARLFDGGSLTMLADAGNRQMLSLVMQDKDGSLVVVDGGWDSDAIHLLDTIRVKGGHVSAWFITHPHSDHVGALYQILKSPNSGITIDAIYYSFAEQSWYEEHDPFRAQLVADLREAMAGFPPNRLHGDIRKGQEISVGGIKVQVLNDPYLLDVTSFNNSSVVYKFFLNGVSILVLGDLGPEGGRLLLQEQTAEALKSDIIQMSHHGQYGVEKDAYAAVSPRICLWSAPQWLWDNDNGGGVGSGDWKTLETRRWMEELGVREHYCIKDGDQVIW